MRTEQLHYFIEVAKAKSINLASERLYISQQTLSSSIKSLEKELGVALLQRTHTGVSLTEAGRAFLDTALGVERLLGDFAKRYVFQPSTLSGELQLYASPVMYTTVLGDILYRFNQQYPAIQINTTEMEVLQLCRQVSDHPPSNALGLVSLSPLLNSDILQPAAASRVTFYPLAAERFYACVNAQSPLAQAKPLTVKTLLKHPLILYSLSGDQDNLLYRLLCAYGQPNIIMTCDNIVLYLQSIANGMGVGFLPGLFTRQVLFSSLMDAMLLLPVADDLRLSIGCLLPDEQKNNEVPQAFLTFLKQYSQTLEETLTQQ